MTLQLFSRIELPDHMLVSELVEWVALGRAPTLDRIEVKIMAGQYEYIDWRRSDDVAIDGAPNAFEEPFSEAEFMSANIKVNYQSYLKIWTDAPYESGQEFVGRASDLAQQFLQSTDPSVSGDAASNIKEIKNTRVLDIIREIEEPFQRLIDRAYSKVFEQLASGLLKSEGWFHGDVNDAELDITIQEVPAAWWTFKNFNLKDSSLALRNQTFNAVQVKVSDAFDRFPVPDLEQWERAGAIYGDTMIVETDSFTVAPKPRGRPTKASATAREVVERVFMERKRKDQLPAKKEALIQEVVEYVKLAFNQDIGRSTAQSYIKCLND